MDNEQNNQNTLNPQTEPVNPPVQEAVQTSVEPVQNQPFQNVPRSTPQPQQPPTEPAAQPQSKSSNIVLLAGSILLVIAIVIGVAYYFFLQNNEPESQSPSPLSVQQTTTTQTQKLTVTNKQEPTPTPDPKENWKTHETTSYQLKYPKDLDFWEDNETLTVSKFGPTQADNTEVFDGYAITIQPIETAQTPQDYTNSLVYEIKSSGISEVTSEAKAVSINNYEGFTFTEEGLGTFKHFILASNDISLLIEISYFVSDPGNLGFQKEVDQILSTFEFIPGV